MVNEGGYAREPFGAKELFVIERAATLAKDGVTLRGNLAYFSIIGHGETPRERALHVRSEPNLQLEAV
jgi:hypothetical protein